MRRSQTEWAVVQDLGEWDERQSAGDKETTGSEVMETCGKTRKTKSLYYADGDILSLSYSNVRAQDLHSGFNVGDQQFWPMGVRRVIHVENTCPQTVRNSF